MSTVVRERLSPSSFIGVTGEGIISFGSGQPDLPPPPEAFEALGRFRDFRYGLIQGLPELREELGGHYPESTPANVVITNGASEALDLALRVIARRDGPGAPKVLMARPYYYSYPEVARYAGLDPVFVRTVDGRIDLDDFSSKVEGCRAVIINSPSNPTGRVEDVGTLVEIERITAEAGIYVLSDEVYKDLMYERENYLINGARVVTINSFSKTYSMCGFRIGYLWSLDADLVSDVVSMKTHTSMNTNILAQEMALAAARAPRAYIDRQLETWRARRDLIYRGLTELGFDVWRPEGAFYVMPRVRDPEDFVWRLYHEHKVITYLGAWFGSPTRVRLSYALDIEKIEAGLARIRGYLDGR